ncbi:unnamed protein product, partial [Phyllotreta striolata]
FTDNRILQGDDDIVAQLLCPQVIIEERSGKVDATGAGNSDAGNLLTDYNITGIKARFYLTDEEEKLRAEIYTPDNPVQYTKIHCTSCKAGNRHLGSSLDSIDNIFVHPVLNVLICKDCFDYYNDGDFENDKDGTEMYCRWCGQGGRVFCCNTCTFVFCIYCVRVNLSMDEYCAIRDCDFWKCFVCDPKQIVKLKVQCYEFVSYVIKELDRIKNMPDRERFQSIDHSKCCKIVPRRRLSARIQEEEKSKINDPDFSPDTPDRNRQSKIRKKITRDHHKEFAKMATNYPDVTLTPLSRTTSSISQLPQQPLQVQIYPETSQSSIQPAHKPPLQLLQVQNSLSRQSLQPELIQTQPLQVRINPTSLIPSYPETSQSLQLLSVETSISRPSSHPELRSNTAPRTSPEPMRGNRYKSPSPEAPKDHFQTQIQRNRAWKMSKQLTDCMMTTALANSSFASTLLSVSKLQGFSGFSSIDPEGDEREGSSMYGSLDKSLELMVQSLVDVKTRLGSSN